MYTRWWKGEPSILSEATYGIVQASSNDNNIFMHVVTKTVHQGSKFIVQWVIPCICMIPVKLFILEWKTNLNLARQWGIKWTCRSMAAEILAFLLELCKQIQSQKNPDKIKLVWNHNGMIVNTPLNTTCNPCLSYLWGNGNSNFDRLFGTSLFRSSLFTLCLYFRVSSF